jgi:hypothetical protein
MAIIHSGSGASAWLCGVCGGEGSHETSGVEAPLNHNAHRRRRGGRHRASRTGNAERAGGVAGGVAGAVARTGTSEEKTTGRPKAPRLVTASDSRDQMLLRDISPAMYSAWRIARATIVSVGFSAALVVNWLPSEMNRLAMSCVWPKPLQTPLAASLL